MQRAVAKGRVATLGPAEKPEHTQIIVQGGNEADDQHTGDSWPQETAQEEKSHSPSRQPRRERGGPPYDLQTAVTPKRRLARDRA